MAASPVLPNFKAMPAVHPAAMPAAHPAEVQQPLPPPVVRTPMHTMPTGVGARSVRRRITPSAGFALEALGHAIEYLADEYVHAAGATPSIHSTDPRVQAMQLLMAANRQVYYSCPLQPSLYQRIASRLFGWQPEHS